MTRSTRSSDKNLPRYISSDKEVVLPILWSNANSSGRLGKRIAAWLHTGIDVRQLDHHKPIAHQGLQDSVLLCQVWLVSGVKYDRYRLTTVLESKNSSQHNQSKKAHKNGSVLSSFSLTIGSNFELTREESRSPRLTGIHL